MGLETQRYFKPGDIEGLAKKINEFISKPLGEDEKKKQIAMIRERYDWGNIAEKTRGVYERVIR